MATPNRFLKNGFFKLKNESRLFKWETHNSQKCGVHNYALHCLGHCSWVLITNNVKKKNMTPGNLGHHRYLRKLTFPTVYKINNNHNGYLKIEVGVKEHLVENKCNTPFQQQHITRSCKNFN